MRIRFYWSYTGDRWTGNEFYIMRAVHAGIQVGHATFMKIEEALVSSGTEVEEEYQKQGIATALYRHAAQVSGLKVKPSTNRSYAGRKFWKNFHNRKNWKRKNFWFIKRQLPEGHPLGW